MRPRNNRRGDHPEVVMILVAMVIAGFMREVKREKNMNSAVNTVNEVAAIKT